MMLLVYVYTDKVTEKNIRRQYTCSDKFDFIAMFESNIHNVLLKPSNLRSNVLRYKCDAVQRKPPPAAIKMPQKTKFISTN